MNKMENITVEKVKDLVNSTEVSTLLIQYTLEKITDNVGLYVSSPQYGIRDISCIEVKKPLNWVEIFYNKNFYTIRYCSEYEVIYLIPLIPGMDKDIYLHKIERKL